MGTLATVAIGPVLGTVGGDIPTYVEDFLTVLTFTSGEQEKTCSHWSRHTSSITHDPRPLGSHTPQQAALLVPHALFPMLSSYN